MNTHEVVMDALRLVPKLIERTREKKLNWQNSRTLVESFAEATATTFATTLEREISITVQNRTDSVKFSMQQEDRLPATTLIEVTLAHNPQYGYDWPGEDELYKQILQLIELARRSAGDIDRKLEELDAFLDQL